VIRQALRRAKRALAKDPDNLAAAFDTESTGGLLAEEDAFDRRLLWRIGSWGFAAVGAIVIAVMANQSSLTLKRDQLAAADIAQQTQQLRNITKESHSEARRLASAIDTLSGDRDRLYARVTSLEQNLDSVTGAIAKQATATAPATSTAATTPGAPPAPVNQPPAQPAAPAPAVAPVATIQPDRPVPAEKTATPTDGKTAVPTDKPAAPAGKAQPTADAPATATDNPASPAVVAMSPASAAAEPRDKKPPPSAPLVAEKSMIGPPDPAAKLIEPARPPAADHVTSEPIPVVMADPDSQVDDEADAPKAQVQRTEFGVDLGTASSVNGLRALWRGLLKSKTNAPLAALRPIIVIKESGNGLGMQLRLVAGPLNDAGTAAKICASLSPNQRTCETAIYDGQRLSLNEQPAAVRPAHRRFLPKRAAVSPPPAPVAAEEKKPEPTTFSSMFRRNSQ
jgi:hypothetical protein